MRIMIEVRDDVGEVEGREWIEIDPKKYTEWARSLKGWDCANFMGRILDSLVTGDGMQGIKPMNMLALAEASINNGKVWTVKESAPLDPFGEVSTVYIAVKNGEDPLTTIIEEYRQRFDSATVTRHGVDTIVLSNDTEYTVWTFTV